MRVRTLCCATVAAVVLGGVALVSPGHSWASPVSPADFTCGVTVFTACNQTAHFDTPDPMGGTQFGQPNPGVETNCPSYVLYDAPAVTGTGNGVEHAIINNNGYWATTTFTGTVRVVYWTVDGNGNPIGPDPLVPPSTGHITEWFGFSGNNKNFVQHDTINFTGTHPDGTPVTFHALDHTSINALPFPETGVNDFHIASC
jgi:hypothetical protein